MGKIKALLFAKKHKLSKQLYWPLGLSLLSLYIPSFSCDSPIPAPAATTTAHAPLITHDSLDSAVSSHSQLKVSTSESGHSSGSERGSRDTSPLDEIVALAAPRKPAHTPSPAPLAEIITLTNRSKSATTSAEIQIIKLPVPARSPRGLVATLRATPTNLPDAASPSTKSPLPDSRSTGSLALLASSLSPLPKTIARPATPTADPDFIPSPMGLRHRLAHDQADTYEHLNVVLQQLKTATYRRANPSALESALEFAQAHRKLDAMITILSYCAETKYQIDPLITQRAHSFLRDQRARQLTETERYLHTKQATIVHKLQRELSSITRELKRRSTLLATIDQLTTVTPVTPRYYEPPVRYTCNGTGCESLTAQRSNSEFGYLVTDAPPSPVARPATPFRADSTTTAQQRAQLSAKQLFSELRRDYNIR